MKKLKNKSKSPMKITLFVMIFFMIIGFSSLSITRFITGGVNLGFNFDDVNVYIANLYSNSINRFNSISEDKKSFNIELQNGTNSVDIYVANNSTQYDEYINFVCNESDLIGVSITPNGDNTNIAYSQVILKNTFVIENTGGTQTLNCRLENLEVESTTKVVEKKRVIFALDGFENETAFKYVDSLTYGDLPIIELDGYEFLGWYNSNDELVESTTEITNFSDEILYGKLESLCILGKVWNFDYTGGEQTFTAPCDGEYKLETWGAQGGNINNYIGGYGGYSVGTILTKKDSKYYIMVGKGGITDATLDENYYPNNMAFNGGGAGFPSGGGATHIATVAGQLSSLASNISDIIIVSGGGGGSKYYGDGSGNYSGDGGSGGGFIGGDGKPATETVYGYGTGGTQSSGGYFTKVDNSNGATYGSFGQGAVVHTKLNSTYLQGAGGGGGFYGGGSVEHGPAGGGSGYIGNSNLSNKAMYCYNCTPSSVESTKTISTKCYNPTPTENCAKQGDGYARITYLGKKYTITNIIKNGSFEDGENNWLLSNSQIITGGYDGTNSLRFSHNNGSDYISMSIQQMTAPIGNHKYYGSLMFKTDDYFGWGTTVQDNRFEIWGYDTKSSTERPLVFGYKSFKSNNWTKLSGIGSLDQNIIDQSIDWKYRNFQRGAIGYSYTDSIIIVDLTETFGEGNEPSKEWCDEHIDWFEGSKIVYK